MNAMKQILGCIRKADQDYGMIADHDRIAVGVSGGKDSMLLLYCLHLYQQFCQRIQSKQFEVVGIHIQMGFPSMDFTDAAVFFKQHGIRLELVPSRIYDILKIQANDDGSLKCSLCSTLKKGAVNRAAKDFGCTKVAFAHHGDDAIETLLMNAIYGGRLGDLRAEDVFIQRGNAVYPPVYLCPGKSDPRGGRKLPRPGSEVDLSDGTAIPAGRI